MVTSAAPFAPAAPPGSCRQGHQRKQADDAGEDHAGFQDAERRQSPARRLRSAALTTGYSVDGGADAGEGDDHLEEAAHGAPVWAPEVRIQSRWFFTEEVEGEGGIEMKVIK